MILQGNFKTARNQYEYSLQIGNIGVTKTITDPIEEPNLNQELVMFSTTPVTITCNREDLLKRIIISQSTITLVTNVNLTDVLFASNNRSIPVEIKKVNINTDDDIVFTGYVDPLQFSSPFSHHFEEFEITATDPLGALEDLTIDKLANINSSSIVSPYNLLSAILTKIGLDIEDMHTIVDQTVWTAFQETKIVLAPFFGDSPDDYASLYDVLETVLKYFNMYVIMEGDHLLLTSSINQTRTQYSITSFKDEATDESTSISVDDVYSQICLTCEIEPNKESVMSLADDDYLHSPYNHQELYMTEVVSPGEGEHAYDAFKQMIQLQAIRQRLNEDTSLTTQQREELQAEFDDIQSDITFEPAYTVDNYCYLLVNDAWEFPNGYTDEAFITDPDPANHDQREALIWLANNKFKGAFIGFGRGDKIQKVVTDNSPKSSVKLENWLVISTMGQLNDTSSYAENTLADAIEDATPICRYTRLTSRILSPPDSAVTNYLIFTGSILLNPLQQKTGIGKSKSLKVNYNGWEEGNNKDIRHLFYPSYLSTARQCWHNTVPNPDNGDGAYYTQAWEYATTKWHGNNDTSVRHPMGLYGYLDNNKNQELKYEYNQNGDAVDKISKIPIIACKLQVGTKYCVERLDLGEQGMGVFQWMTQDDIDNYNAEHPNNDPIQPYFTIGIDPKIGDNIIGQTFNIQNNISYTQGLDTTGTAIPITYDDHLAGTVIFEICGPYNVIYAQTTKSTHTKFLFWKCKHQNTTDITLLEHIQSIMIKNLKMDVKSDNGLRSTYATTADNDLVYASNVNKKFTDKLEDDVKICTRLTFEECEQYGVKYQISDSYVLNADNSFFEGFTVSKIKPEQCLVDYLYNEYTDPAKKLETKVKTSAFTNGPLGNQMSLFMLDKAISGIYPGVTATAIMSYETDLKMQQMNIDIRELKKPTNIQF